MSQRAELRTKRTGHTSSLQENRHCTYHWDSLRTLALFYTIHRYNHPENTTQGVAIRIKKGKEKSKGKDPLNIPLSIENIVMTTFHIIKFQRPPYILCAFPTHRTCPSMLCQRTSAYDESFLIHGTSLWNSPEFIRHSTALCFSKLAFIITSFNSSKGISECHLHS